MEWSLSLLSSWWGGIGDRLEWSGLPDELWFKILSMAIGDDLTYSPLWIYYLRVSKRWLKLITGRLTEMCIDGPGYARLDLAFKKQRKRLSSYFYTPTIRELGQITAGPTTDFLFSRFRYLQRITLWNAASLKIKASLLNMPYLTALKLSHIDDDLAQCIGDLCQLRELDVINVLREPDFLSSLTNITHLAYQIIPKREQDHGEILSWISAVVNDLTNLEYLEASESFCLDRNFQDLQLDLSYRLPNLTHLDLQYQSVGSNPSALTVRFNPTQLKTLKINMGGTSFPSLLKLPQLQESTPLALEQLDLDVEYNLMVNFASLTKLKKLSVPLAKIDPTLGQANLSAINMLCAIEELDFYRSNMPTFSATHCDLVFQVVSQYRNLTTLHIQPIMARRNENDHEGIVGLLADSNVPIRTLRFPCYTYEDIDYSPVDVRNWSSLLALPDLETLEVSERFVWCQCTAGPLVKHNALFPETIKPHDSFCLFRYLTVAAMESLKKIYLTTVREQRKRRFVYESHRVWPGFDDRCIFDALDALEIDGNRTELCMRSPGLHVTEKAFRRLQNLEGIKLIVQ